MRQYINFLERFSQEKHFYTSALSTDGKVEWEIYWSTTLNSDGLWGIKRKSDSTWQFFDGEQLCNTLRFFRINTKTIETELIGNIKSMVTYAKIMESEAKKIFGDSFVDTTLGEFKAFSEALTHLIIKHTPEVSSEIIKKAKAKRPKLGLVKNTEI